MLVNATEMLIKARDGHYGVPQFNINNLEWTKAVLTACEEMKSPVILGVSEGAGKYMTGFKTVAAMVDAMVDSMGITVPVALHLDHGTYEGCKACVEAGFSSIMFDGSHYSIEENVAKTTELVALAHSKGMSIEAEVGSIGGVEDGVVGNGEIADPAECAKITDLGIDFLGCRHRQHPRRLPGQLEGSGLRGSGPHPQGYQQHSSGPARRHRHPRRHDRQGHQPRRLQDQHQHRVPAGLR